MCQTKDIAIKDWVKLAVSRARATGSPPCSGSTRIVPTTASCSPRWMPTCPNTTLDIRYRPGRRLHPLPERARNDEDTISVTGNVLRDYLTFPILELGTSAKMLSIVPLHSGGGLYETGAGGSAPKHVQQFNKETTCAGTASANSWPWVFPSKTWPKRAASPRPRCWPTPSTPPPANG